MSAISASWRAREPSRVVAATCSVPRIYQKVRDILSLSVDYSLKIATLPEREAAQASESKPASPAKKGRRAAVDAPSLFDEAEG